MEENQSVLPLYHTLCMDHQIHSYFMICMGIWLIYGMMTVIKLSDLYVSSSIPEQPLSDTASTVLHIANQLSVR